MTTAVERVSVPLWIFMRTSELGRPTSRLVSITPDPAAVSHSCAGPYRNSNMENAPEMRDPLYVAGIDGAPGARGQLGRQRKAAESHAAQGQDVAVERGEDAPDLVVRAAHDRDRREHPGLGGCPQRGVRAPGRKRRERRDGGPVAVLERQARGGRRL